MPGKNNPDIRMIKLAEKENLFPKLLGIIFLLAWILLAIKPVYRFDWFLENILVFVSVPFLIFFYRKNFFSDLSYALIFIFLMFHIVGAHYTFSEVPAGKKISECFGWERNHYDRMVHFLFGALLTVPVFEIISQKVSADEKWKLLFSFSLVFTAGGIYELLEWLTAIVVSPEAGSAYLGTQGDEWDAQKDLGLKLAGSLAAVIFLLRKRK